MTFFQSLISWILPPVCAVCGCEGSWLCGPARREIVQQRLITDVVVPGVDRVLCRGSYDCRPLNSMIRQIKYAGWQALDEEFESILEPLIERLGRWPAQAAIVPVPLHRRRSRERGFNQAVNVARAVARYTNLTVQPLLERVRMTRSQAQLSEHQRRHNVLGAFRVRQKSQVPGQIILVDDVITTGATIQACALALREHGAAHITAVALAKG